MPDRSPYEVLGLARDATPEQVRSAWRAACLRHHPDRGGDPERFREALAAFELLSDPTRRAAVDGGTLRLEDLLQLFDELGPDLVRALASLRAVQNVRRRGWFASALELLAAAAVVERVAKRLAQVTTTSSV